MVFIHKLHLGTLALLMLMTALLVQDVASDAKKDAAEKLLKVPGAATEGLPAGKPQKEGDRSGPARGSALMTEANEMCNDLKEISKEWSEEGKQRLNKLCNSVNAGIRTKLFNELKMLKITMLAKVDWTCDDWKFVMAQGGSSIQPNIDDMPSDCVTAMMENESFMKDMMKAGKMMKKLTTKLQSSLGATSQWDAGKLRNAKNIIGSMPINDLKNLSVNAIKDALADLKDIRFHRPDLKAAMAKKVIEALGGTDNADKWSSDDIINGEQFIRSSPRAMAKLSNDALKESLNTIGKKKLKRRESVLFAKRLKKIPEYKDPTQINKDTLKNMGSVLASMGNRYLDQIPDDVLAESIDTIKTTDLSRSEKRIIFRKLKKTATFKNMNISDMTFLGNLVGGLKADELKSFGKGAFKNITQFKSIKLAATQQRVVVSKFKEGGEWGTVARTLGPLMKVLKPSEFTSLSFSDLALGCDNTTEIDLQATDIQANFLLDTVQKEITSSKSKYSGACFERWGCFARRALSRSFVDGLSEDETLLQAADSLASKSSDYMNECIMKSSVAKHLALKLQKHMMLTDATASVANLDDDKIDIISNFMPYLNEEMWKYLTPKQVNRMIPIIGKGTNGVSRVIYTKLKDLALRNIYNDESGQVVDKTKAAIDSNTLDDMGILRCFLSPENMKRMTSDAFENHLADMQTCPFTLTQGLQLYTSYNRYFPEMLQTKEDIIRGAGILLYSSVKALQEASQEALADSYSDVLQSLAEKHRVLQLRDEEGFKYEIPDNDRKAQTALEFRMLRQFVIAVMAQESLALIDTSSSNGTSGRKRREPIGTTQQISCTDIHQAGYAARAFADDLLNTLTEQDFKDCVEELGEINTWSESQLSALVAVAQTAWGSPETWTAENMEEASNILAGLTGSQLASMKITDIDILVSVAHSELFNAGQIEAMFTVWLNKAKDNNIMELTAEEIAQIGNLVCGTTPEQIMSITVDIYKDSTTTWGRVTKCNHEQLKAISHKAIEAFGSDPTSWSVTTLRQIGPAVVASPDDVLAKLPISLLTEIPPSHMKLMSPHAYQVLSVEQLTALTDEQKEARTADQLDALSSEQKAVFDDSDSSSDSGGDNASGTNKDLSDSPDEEASKSAGVDPVSNSSPIVLLFSICVAYAFLHK